MGHNLESESSLRLLVCYLLSVDSVIPTIYQKLFISDQTHWSQSSKELIERIQRKVLKMVIGPAVELDMP